MFQLRPTYRIPMDVIHVYDNTGMKSFIITS